MTDAAASSRTPLPPAAARPDTRAADGADAPFVAFVGGGNMAQAIVGGLRRQGWPAGRIGIVEPHGPTRERLAQVHGVPALAAADASLQEAALLVWAVKPQSFAEAAAPVRAALAGCAPLQLSIMAGVRLAAIASATGSDRIVRAMPNTPALIGRGITGLAAPPLVAPDQRALVERVLAPTGALAWVAHEDDLDAVTALSGSGPAYVFYLIDAMVRAGTRLGLPPALARQLAEQTFAGAAALSAASPERTPGELREQVTSRGGTTHAAITAMQAARVAEGFEAGVAAAHARARELGAG